MAFTESDLKALLDPAMGNRTINVERMTSNINGTTSIYVTGTVYPYQGAGVWVDVQSSASAAAAVNAIMTAVKGAAPVTNTNIFGATNIRPNDMIVTGSSGIRTNNFSFEAEAPFVAVRLVYMEVNTSGTMPNIEALVGATDTYSTTSAPNLYYPTVAGVNYNSMRASTTSPGWARVTFGGNNIGVPTPATSTNRCSYLISDRIPLSSLARTDVVGARPRLVARVANTNSAAVFSQGTSNNQYYTNGSGQASYRDMRTFGITTDGVNNLNNVPGGVGGGYSNEIACFFIYEYASPVRQFLFTGDSRKSCAFNTYVSSWETTALRSIANPSQPICVNNRAGSGHSQDQYIALVNAYLDAGGSATDIVIPAYSQNGFVNGATFIAKNQVLIDRCTNLGMRIWMDTDYVAGLPDTERQICLNYAKNLGAQGKVTIIDTDAIVTDYTTNPGSPQFKSGASTGGDSVHVGPAFQDMLSALFISLYS